MVQWRDLLKLDLSNLMGRGFDVLSFLTSFHHS